MNNLKTTTTYAIAWNFFEKISIKFGQLVISILLARLLVPSDFGTIAMLTIFLNISQVLIDSGLPKALIQSVKPSKIDYSSVFVFNVVFSILVYVFLFFVAPLVANFYDEPLLINLLRVLAITLVLNSFVLVPTVKLNIALDFKQLAKINLLSIIGSGCVGIVAALCGFGVWSIVIQSISRSLLSLLAFWKIEKWDINFKVSSSSIKRLWHFSSKLLLASVVAEMTNNIYNLFIGKNYLASELGYYHRSNNLTSLASDTVTQSIQQVTFPVLSSLQDNKDRMIDAYKRMIKMSSFIMFPVMILISTLAGPIVKILLSDEWLPVIPFLQWMAFTRILYPINSLNLNLLTATGRSDLFLKVDLSKLPISVIALVITLPLGIKSMIIGQVICSVFYYAINTIMPGRIYGYHFFRQLKDLLPYIVSSGIMYVSVIYSLPFLSSVWSQLFVGGVIGITVYLLVCRLLKVQEFQEITLFIQGIFKK